MITRTTYKIKRRRQDLIQLSTLTNSPIETKEGGIDNEHLVVETDDAERRPDAAERQRHVVQKQSVDTLTVRKPADDDTTDRV